MMDKVIESLKEQNQRDRLGIELADLIISYMRVHEGQKISKRIATSIKETLQTLYGPEVMVHYSTDYSCYSLRVWGGIFGNFDNAFNFTLGYLRESGNYDSITFIENNTCYGEPAKNRIQNRNDFINSPSGQAEFAERIDTYQKAQKNLKDALDGLEASYTIQKVYDLDL